jgi:cyclopropane fatty-acyl-phospholipid synthase-like methyltransferase
MASYKDKEEGYKGIPVHALEGLHEIVAELVRRHMSRGAKLAELAAGGGALTLRLHEMGFQVNACDYVTENFRLHGQVRFIQQDLNAQFSQNFSGCEGVVAVEIIEHLENPRHFLREIRAILPAGGVAIVTTPNVESPVSVAMSIRSGRPIWFWESAYRSDGHITPVPQWIIEQASEEAGLEVVEVLSHGDPYRWLRAWPRLHLLAKLIGYVTPRDRPRGELILMVLRAS